MTIQIFALDRIESIGSVAQELTLWASKVQSRYIETKSLHPSRIELRALLQPLGIIHNTRLGSHMKNLLATLAWCHIIMHHSEVGVAYLGPELAIGELTHDANIVPMALIEVKAWGDLRVSITKHNGPIGVTLDGKVVGSTKRYHRKHTPRDLIYKGVIVEG
jgi:hypothetical protein